MKDKVKISILLLFVTILSALNLKNGLVFHTTDNTERDAAFSAPSEINETIEKKKSPVITANVPKKAVSDIKLKYSANILKRVSCSIQGGIPALPNTQVINYCVYTDYSGSGSGTFYYGHESGVFKNLKTLKVGDKFVLGNKTYKVANKFYKSTKELNKKTKEASDLRSRLFKSTGYNITIQTCNGANSRLYIQAVAV